MRLTANTRRIIGTSTFLALVALVPLGGMSRADAEAVIAPTTIAEQVELQRLGLPVGPIDGVAGPMTQQARCGRSELRRGVRPSPRTFAVSISCQLGYLGLPDGRIEVTRVSTGRDGYPTRPGTYVVGSRERGEVVARDAKGNRRGVMENPAFYDGALYAVHGGDVRVMERLSSGCVRVPWGYDTTRMDRVVIW